MDAHEIGFRRHCGKADLVMQDHPAPEWDSSVHSHLCTTELLFSDIQFGLRNSLFETPALSFRQASLSKNHVGPSSYRSRDPRQADGAYRETEDNSFRALQNRPRRRIEQRDGAEFVDEEVGGVDNRCLENHADGLALPVRQGSAAAGEDSGNHPRQDEPTLGTEDGGRGVESGEATPFRIEGFNEPWIRGSRMMRDNKCR